MVRRVLRLAGLAACLAPAAALPAAAWDVQAVDARTEDVWQRFAIHAGTRAGVAWRGLGGPRLAPDLSSVLALNYKNGFEMSALRSAWLEAAQVGAQHGASVAVGPSFGIDRHLSLASSAQPGELPPSARIGGFFAIRDGGQELARFSVASGRLGGIDLKASRTFKLSDSVSIGVGPTLAFGTAERFGYAAPAIAAASGASAAQDRAQLSAFGLAGAVETRLGGRTVASMFAEYARIDQQRNPAGRLFGNRDRVDFGFSLSTTLGD